MMMTTNHLQMFSGNNAQCPINENFSFSIALVQNMLVTHLGRPSLNPRLMSERNLPPAQNLEDARFIRASCVLGGGGSKGVKELLEIHRLFFSILISLTTCWIFVTLFCGDTCFFIELMDVLFIREGRIINHTKIEHLRVY